MNNGRRYLYAAGLIFCCISSSSHAANMVFYKGKYGGINETAIQVLGDNEVMYCFDEPNAGWGCKVWAYSKANNGWKVQFNQSVPIEQSARLEFAKRGSTYTLVFKEKNSVSSQWSHAKLDEIERSLSKRKYAGKFETGESTSIQFSNRKVNYCYQGQCNLHSYKIFGEIARVSFGNGARFFITPVEDDRYVGTFVHGDGRQFIAQYNAQAYVFANSSREQSKCVQAHLNAAGYNVGKVDGAIGSATQAKAEEWRVDTNSQLAALSRETVKDWCTSMSSAREEGIDITKYLE